MSEQQKNTIHFLPILYETEFIDMLNLPKAIIYISVNWSDPERISRAIIRDVLNSMKNTAVPIFKIDCSEQENRYVENWLCEQSSGMQYLYSNGYGEILLVYKGQVVDFIRFPAQLGLLKTQEKIQQWLNT